MLRNYETVFVVSPVLSDAEVKKTIGKFRDVLTQQGASLTHEEPIGQAKLAYPIAHKTHGIYHVIEFEAEPSAIATLETAYRRDPHILRYLTVSLDKHALAYNAEERSSGKKTSISPKAQQA